VKPRDEIVLEGLAGMIALWEATFDEEHRCRCQGFAGPGRGQLVSLLDRPCAYCAAVAALDQGRLQLDETIVGRG